MKAVVTGASSGIGKEYAYILAEEGYNLLLVARRKNKLVEIKQEIEEKHKVNVKLAVADLSKPEKVQPIVDSYPQPDVVINNAGFGELSSFIEQDIEKIQDMINLNITSLTLFTRLYGKQMKESGKGHIQNVASVAAFLPGPYMAVYYATKAYVLTLTESIASEMKGTGVSVTALCPGATHSEFQRVAKLNNVEILNNDHLPSSKTVAQYGYDTMMKNKIVAVQGFTNKALVILQRILPRAVRRRIMHRLQSSRSTT